MLEVTAAIIKNKDKFLICQRPKGKSCELLWEFPGGKMEPGETGEHCIIRECQEELGVTLDVQKEITDVIYEYPDRTVHLHFFLTQIKSGVLSRKEHNAFSWITAMEISKYTFCPADQKMIQGFDFLKI